MKNWADGLRVLVDLAEVYFLKKKSPKKIVVLAAKYLKSLKKQKYIFAYLAFCGPNFTLQIMSKERSTNVRMDQDSR